MVEVQVVPRQGLTGRKGKTIINNRAKSLNFTGANT